MHAQFDKLLDTVADKLVHASREGTTEDVQQRAAGVVRVKSTVVVDEGAHRVIR